MRMRMVQTWAAISLAAGTALSTLPGQAWADPGTPAPASGAPASSPTPLTTPGAPPATGTEAVAPNASAPASPVSRRTVAFVAAGVAGAGAVTAAIFGGLALKNKRDYASDPTYTRSDDGNNDAAYADGALALAVAAGVTSLVLFLTSEPKAPAPAGSVSPKPALGFSAAPIVLSHGGGAAALLRF